MSEHTNHKHPSAPGHAVHETAPLIDPPDAWHDHSHDTEKPQHAHAEVGSAMTIMGVGLLAFVMVCVSVVAVQGYYTHYTTQKLNDLERHAGNTGERVRKDIIRERDLKISEYVWADHDRVQVPMEQGVAKVLAEYAQRNERK